MLLEWALISLPDKLWKREFGFGVSHYSKQVAGYFFTRTYVCVEICFRSPSRIVPKAFILLEKTRMFAKKMKTSDKKNKTFRFKDLYLPTFSLSLSGYRFILLLRKGRMLGVTAKLGIGFVELAAGPDRTCIKILNTLARKVVVSRLHKFTVFTVQAYRVHCTGLSCLVDKQSRFVPCNKVDKVVAVGFLYIK